MTHRIPIIITNIIDQLTQDKEAIIERYGSKSREELKACIGEISKLKYELQTDKKMLEIPGEGTDQDVWNNMLREITPNNSYFSSIWLHSECYIYRRLKSIFEQTESLKDFDYFEKSKKLELKNSMETIARVIKSANEFNANKHSETELCEFFCKLLKINLWGNKNDLSITLGIEIEQNGSDPIKDIDTFNKELLVDQTDDIWKCISVVKENKIVDFINDNSGYELLCDLVLADFMIHHHLAERIRFHVKAIPWFISDVLPKDFKYTIDELKKSDMTILQEVGQRWDNYLSSGKFVLIEPADHFYTSPHEFSKMKEMAPTLYESIAEADLVIFKGDLNYRKLLADINWDTTTDFRTALSGFEPTNLCSLRTIKADLVCGLKPGVAEKLWAEDSKWMTTGNYGLIQFCSK